MVIVLLNFIFSFSNPKALFVFITCWKYVQDVFPYFYVFRLIEGPPEYHSEPRWNFFCELDIWAVVNGFQYHRVIVS